MATGRTLLRGHPYFALPLFDGLRTLAGALLTSRARTLVAICLKRQPPLPDAVARVGVEKQMLGTRRSVMHVIWKLLKNWPDTFEKYANAADVHHYVFDQVRPSNAFWLQAGIDRMPGARQREVGMEEAITIANWLKAQGEPVARNRILELAGVSVPVRTAQPAVNKVVSERAVR